MATNVEALTLQVQSNAADAGKPVKALAESLTALKNAMKGGGFKNLEKLSDALSGLSEATSQLDDSVVSKLTRVTDALTFLGLAKVKPSLEKNLKAVIGAVNSLDEGKVALLKDMTSSLSSLSTLGPIRVSGLKNLGKNASATAELPTTPKPATKDTETAKEMPWNAEAWRNGLNNLKADYATIPQFFSQIGGKIGSSISAPFKNMAESIGIAIGAVHGFNAKVKGVGAAIKGAWDKITGFSNAIKGKFTLGLLSGENALSKLFSAFKRIALYRAIRFLFSQLTNAMKEGINNLYQYSALMGTEFAGSMDRLATSFLYLKNSMGAAASPLINALAPAIDFAIDKIVELLNWFNQLVSRLRGASTWTKAVKYATSYAGAAESAAGSTRKAAKALKDYTIGIDELNVIRPDDDTGSGGGGGGGAATPDYSKMFEEEPIDEGISDFADRLKKAFKAGNWKQLGTLLGDKINGIVDSVPWGGIGTRMGKMLNGVIQTMYYTLDTTNFVNIGSKIATLLNNAMNNIDFSYLGRLLIKGVTIAFDLLIGFVSTIDTGRLATAVSEFISGAFNEASKWIHSINWEELGTTLYNKVKDFVTNIDWASIVSSVFSLVGSLLGGVGSFAWGILEGAWTDLESAFTDEGELTWDSFKSGLKNAVTNIGTWIKDNIWTPFWEGLTKAFGGDELGNGGSTVVGDFLQGIVDGLSNIGTWIKDHFFTPIWTAIQKAFGLGGGKSSETEKQGKQLPSGLYSGISKNVPTGRGTLTGWASKVLSWFSGFGNASLLFKFGAEGKGIVNKFNEKTGVNALSTRSIMTTWAKNVKTWFSTEASADSFSTFAKNIIDGFANGITNFASRCWNSVTTWAKGIKNLFTKEMDEHSPSKIFFGYGKNVVLGFNNGIDEFRASSLLAVKDWASGIQRCFAPVLSVDYSNLAGVNDYVGAMSATASYNASVQAEASFVDESLLPLLQTIAEATTRQANKSETTTFKVNGRDLVSSIDKQRRANGYKVAY